MMNTYDVIVIGAGHAGIEAALACARTGCKTALVTQDARAVGRMSCNPAVGGLGKGHLVREIDALGGEMGRCADATGIQFRRLNQRKGAAVRGTRCQSDKDQYAARMTAVVQSQANLDLVEGEVAEISFDGDRVNGVALADQSRLPCRALVLTTGTFLAGLMHVGPEQRVGGRIGEQAATRLSQSLRALGVRLGRLKTGTPCRLDGNTIDVSGMQLQPGDDPPPQFSFWETWPAGKPPLPQVPCHITSTNARTHEIIRANLHHSPMYSGAIQGVGPRYCPSIEDKVVRFAQREGHHIFVEPEGLNTNLIYPNGISTGLPAAVQDELVHSIRGFENAKIMRYGYAVEYDYSDPQQLLPTLQLRGSPGFFFAGQINGTTGYEEAAAQGILAGINASLFVREKDPVVLTRDQAYIAVMVDDLVTQGTREPYRMFTSRAEYRLILREDNADDRLTPIGRDVGLIDDATWAVFCERKERREALRNHLEKGLFQPGLRLAEYLRRPEATVASLGETGLLPEDLSDDKWVVEPVELDIKYAPYVERQREDAQRLATLEHKRLPDKLDYNKISGLRGELVEKLSKHRPHTLGQASRIPGMTPAALALLEVHLHR